MNLIEGGKQPIKSWANIDKSPEMIAKYREIYRQFDGNQRLWSWEGSCRKAGGRQ